MGALVKKHVTISLTDNNQSGYIYLVLHTLMIKVVADSYWLFGNCPAVGGSVLFEDTVSIEEVISVLLVLEVAQGT